MRRVVPNHANRHQDGRQQRRDVGRFRHRQRLARFLQRGEKLGVVARGFRLILHDVAQIQKRGHVCRFGSLEDAHRRDELRVPQLIPQAGHVLATPAPERDLRQRAQGLVRGLRVCVDDFANLSRPVDDDGLEPLHEIFARGGCVGGVVALVPLRRDVELGLAPELVRLLGELRHVAVDSARELLADGLRPLLLRLQRRGEDALHDAEQRPGDVGGDHRGVHQFADRERVHRLVRVPDEREHPVPPARLRGHPRGDHEHARGVRVARLPGGGRTLEVREQPRGFDAGEELDRRRVVFLRVCTGGSGSGRDGTAGRAAFRSRSVRPTTRAKRVVAPPFKGR